MMRVDPVLKGQWIMARQPKAAGGFEGVRIEFIIVTAVAAACKGSD